MRLNKRPQTILVTGGLGFIGSHLVEKFLREGHTVINYDKMTYAANPELNEEFEKMGDYTFVQCDIAEIKDIPFCDMIVNMAAESHVDNSIEDSFAFIKTNILGVHNILEIIKDKRLKNMALSWEYKPPLFYQCSTDEVFGDIIDGFFGTDERHKPSNPYAAAKSAAEQLVVAWGRTYDLPYIITRTTNNYGKRQHPEKLIPRAVTNLLAGKKVPIHGGGRYIRNWIHVEDNVDAIYEILDKGDENSSYHIASEEEFSVKEVVTTICEELGLNYDDYADLSSDRSGADVRYALAYESTKEFGWAPKREFAKSMSEIVEYWRSRAKA